MTGHFPWNVLAIDPTDDRGAIRRAYAQKLRSLDMEREVEAYARLRAARDHALALAKSAANGAGDQAERNALAGGELASDHIDVLFEGAQPDGTDFAGPAEPGEAPAAELREPIPPEILNSLLFPGGEQSAEGLDYNELEQASAAVEAIADEAHAAPIDVQRGIEEWLAHQLALAWPRSTHLVKRAAERFAWEEQSGMLNELPAVRFLNLRLRGMRFVEQVNEPTHALHLAWTELSRPGRRTMLSRLRATKSDVLYLLKGIRERYPEVEGYLDPVRVASWENPSMSGSEAGGSAGFVVLLAIFALKLLLAISPSTSGTPQPVALPDVTVSAEAEERGAALALDIFGTTEAVDKLPVAAPELNSAFNRYRSMAPESPEEIDSAMVRMRNLARLLAFRAASTAGFEDLVAIKRIELALLEQGQSQGGAELCNRVFKGDFASVDLELPVQDRQQERQLYMRLLDANLLIDKGAKFPESAPISAEVVAEVKKATGFAPEVIKLAAQGKAGADVQCRYRIALLEAVLKRPGKVSAELLRLI